MSSAVRHQEYQGVLPLIQSHHPVDRDKSINYTGWQTEEWRAALLGPDLSIRSHFHNCSSWGTIEPINWQIKDFNGLYALISVWHLASVTSSFSTVYLCDLIFHEINTRRSTNWPYVSICEHWFIEVYTGCMQIAQTL